MQKKDLKKYKIPSVPGVYIFRGARKKILYIGKATDLRSRVRSYFGKDLQKSRGALLVKMLEEAKSLDWQKTDSVLEALILEANLIKKYQPQYNTDNKDNKSFNYVVITKEDLPTGQVGFPRVIIVRERELLSSRSTKFKIKYTFGPFTQASVLKEALKIVRKIFPYRDKCQPYVASAKHGKPNCKPCFNRQIGLCPGVCRGEISKKEYARIIRNIALLFQGKKGALLKKLAREMREAAKREDFELAAELRNKIFTLEHINDVSLIRNEYKQSMQKNRIEGYDVAHIGETARVGVMTVLEDGKPAKSEYRKFKIKTRVKGDIAALKEILERRFAHEEWPLPKLIVVDGSKAQINIAKKVLKEFGYKIPIVGVVKNDKHKPERILSSRSTKFDEKEVLLANAEAHRFAINFHRKLKRRELTGK